MTMLKSFNWVKDAMSGKGLATMHLFYLVRDGMITMTDGRMWASHPWPSEDTFCAVGEATAMLLGRLPEPVTLKLGENDVVFRSGRLKGTIKTHPDTASWPMNKIDDSRLSPIPDGFIDALRKLRPFISDNAARPWALCALAHEDSLYATNNIAVATVVGLDLELGEHKTLIPNWAIDFIISRAEGLEYWYAHTEKGHEYLGFQWANGAWMRTQLADSPDNFPTRVEQVIADAPPADHAITAEWREAWDHAAALSANVVTIYADKIIGINKEKESEKTMDVTIEVVSPCPKDTDYSCWDPRYVEPVIVVATHWNPDQYPNPCPFRGDGILGVVMGRRK